MWVEGSRRHENTAAQAVRSSLPVIITSSLLTPDHQNQEGRLFLTEGTASAMPGQKFGTLQW